MRLTEIEKLDASYPTLAFSVKALLDQGQPSQAIAERINTAFGTSISEAMVAGYRVKRWVPEKERAGLQMITIQAAIGAFGGDAGLDAALLAKLWELMDRMTVPQLLSARALFLKVRAQNLKEQEFLYKTGQLQSQQEIDPQQQQRNVLRRIKEIFGLAGDEPAPLPPANPADAGAPPAAKPAEVETKASATAGEDAASEGGPALVRGA